MATMYLKIISDSVKLKLVFLALLVVLQCSVLIVTAGENQLGGAGKGIEIKLFQLLFENSTTDEITIDSQPNRTITISKENSNIHKIALVCTSANGPVSWEYFINGKNFTALLETSYQRILRPTTKLDNKNSEVNEQFLFQANVTLRGLLESQTGIYSCKHVVVEESSLQKNIINLNANNIFENLTSYIDLKIIGTNIFMDEKVEIVAEKNMEHVDIWCQISNPHLELTLWKASRYEGKVILEPIVINNPLFHQSDHTQAEILRNQLRLGLFSLKNTNESYGHYICTAGDKNSTIDVVPWNERKPRILRDEFDDFTNVNYLKILRWKRRACDCPNEKDFSKIFDSNPKRILSVKGCGIWKNKTRHDWKVGEFYDNGEINCLENDDFVSNIELSRSKRTWHNLTVICYETTTYTNLSIIFYSFDELLTSQGAVRIGIQKLRNIFGGLTDIEYLNSNDDAEMDNENDSLFMGNSTTKSTVLIPEKQWASGLGLMKYVWNLPFLNMTRIHRLHLFVPYKYSTDWKQFIASFVNDQPMSKFIYVNATQLGSGADYKNLRNIGLRSTLSSKGLIWVFFGTIYFIQYLLFKLPMICYDFVCYA